METRINGLAIAAAVIAIAVVGYLTGTQLIRNQAVHECAQTALSLKNGEFVQSIYQFCLKDKGYETQVK